MLAVDAIGVQLEKELFNCILNVACNIIRADKVGAEFNIKGFCTGTISINPVVSDEESIDDLGVAFLVHSTVKHESGGETFLKFYLPKKVKEYKPQIESYENFNTHQGNGSSN